MRSFLLYLKFIAPSNGNQDKTCCGYWHYVQETPCEKSRGNAIIIHLIIKLIACFDALLCKIANQTDDDVGKRGGKTLYSKPSALFY